jgi:hypothetical protein
MRKMKRELKRGKLAGIHFIKCAMKPAYRIFKLPSNYWLIAYWEIVLCMNLKLIANSIFLDKNFQNLFLLLRVIQNF